MIKNNEQKLIFTGKNFETILEKLPLTTGRLFVVGVKNQKRMPISMFEVKSKKLGRRETIKGKFMRKIESLNSGRKEYLINLINENNYENLLIEWE